MTFFKGSFYERVALFTENEKGETVFAGLRARPVGRPEPILEHTIRIKERLDTLAHNYFADSRAWRRIAEANPGVVFPEDLLFEPVPVDENGRERTGEVVLIPRRKDSP